MARRSGEAKAQVTAGAAPQPASRRTPVKKAPPKAAPTKKAPAKKAPAKKAPAKKVDKGSPPEFGPRGRRLWDAYVDVVDGEAGKVLLEEAARMADRLDRLHALLKGDVDVWARLIHRTRTDDYELVIDGALIEARRQTDSLRQLVGALPLKGAAGDGDDDGDAWLDALPT